MAQLNKIIAGLTKYIDSEMLPKINGLNKWVFGAGVNMALSKSTEIFNSLKSNDFIKSLNVIDKNDNIDIETVYKNLIIEAKKNAVTFNVPFVGVITLTDKDVEKLYMYINEA